MLGCAAVISAPTTARAQDDYVYCGTKWPGWWWQVRGPHSLIDNLKVVQTIIGSPYIPAGATYTVYPVRFILHNYGKTATPAQTPYSVEQNMVGSAGYWSPDQPFDPNNPINPYARLFFYVSTRAYLPAVQAGAEIGISGNVAIPASLAKTAAAQLLSVSLGY